MKELKHYQMFLTGKNNKNHSEEFFANDLKEAVQSAASRLKELSNKEFFDFHVEEIV